MKKIKLVVKMAFSYLKAKLGPRNNFEEYLKRLNACSTCSWNVEKKNRNYCKGCMCPQSILWPDAELRTKASYKYATCPRRKW
jgi:hypothetical protein